MSTIKVYLTDEQYTVIQEDADQIGLPISTYLRFLALNKKEKKLTQVDKKDSETVNPEKPKKEKMTALDKLIWRYKNLYPNAKIFIRDSKIVIQDRRTPTIQIEPLPPDIEGDPSKYPEGEKLIVPEIKRDTLHEFDSMGKE